jgi:hypothetical protein
MDFPDALIFVGSYVVGAYADDTRAVFAGGLTASLGINIEFEMASLSIPRIVVLSLAGFGAGYYMKKKNKPDVHS